ncbi:ABC transporter permease [Loigolactobacillus zhaoyuanensis]|uniref:ABC transporter permease n=1 Tax=Loigolactobacillus zhaoyuanensis TaxID=2486017 RepID=A0ABW8UH06_9LACO
MHNNNFSQAGYLTRFYLRRDWLKILIWLIGLVGLMGIGGGKFDGLYGTKAAMNSIVATLKTPAMISMFGPFTAQQPYNVALIFAMEMMVFMGLFMAIMNIYFAVKATRAEEDNGILELVRAHAVGKYAPLLAATLELLIINLVIGILESLSLIAANMTGANVAGSWLFGLGLAAVGFMFGVFSLLMAQLSDNARGATILSYLVLAILFLVRMLTDVTNPDYTWWSPFGWIEKLSVYDQNIWWPVLAMLGVALLVIGATFYAYAHRDVTAGLIATRPGRKQASALLAGPLTLIFRLERTSFIVWLIGLFVLGASYGSIFGTVGDIMKTNPMVAQLMGSKAVNAATQTVILNFAALLAIVFVVLSTIPAMQIILKLNGDERKGWLEQIHAKSISRLHLYCSYVVLALITGSLSLLLGVIGMYAAGQSVMDTPIPLSRFLRAFYGYLPALLVTVGISAVFAGLLPRLQAISWLVPIYGFISLYLGNLLDLPKWAVNLTPYGWINNVPLRQVQWPLTGALVALAFALFVIGFMLYRRRDMVEN